MKYLIVLVFTCFLITSLKGQSQFQLTYSPTSGSLQSFAESVQQTSDGGFITCGWENYLPMKMYVVKTDIDGNVTWAKRYGKELLFGAEDPTALLMATCIRQTADGGYIVTGSMNNKCFLLKLTSVGVASWAKTYGGGDSSYGNYVKQASDGGYLVAGYSYSGASKDSADAYMLKTASNGNLTWDKLFRFSTVDDDIAYAIEESSDGYIITGSTGQIIGTDTTTDVFMVKTNTAGVIQWSNTRGGDTDFDDGYHLRKATDGDILVCGSTSQGNGKAFVWKVANATGAINWGKTLNIGLEDMGIRVEEKGGKIYLFGTSFSSFILSFLDMFCVKLSSDGSTVENGWVYSQMLSANFMRDAQVCSDNGFILGGWGQSPLMTQDFLVVKTNSNGVSGCNESTTSVSIGDFAPHAEVVTPTINGPTSATSWTALNFNVTPVSSILCQVVPVVASAGTSSNVCQGRSFTLGGSPTASGGQSPYTYAWSSSPAGFSSTLANPVATPSGTTTYTVTVTDANSTTATSSITLTQINNPAAEAGGNVTICQGETTQLGASGGGTYLWSPTGYLSNAAISNPNAYPTVTTVYTVTVTGANTCTASDQVTVTVNSLPSASSSNMGPYCVGENIQLNATGGTGFTWSGPNSFASTTQNPLITSATVGMGGNYTVVIQGSNGCTVSSQTNVIVNANPSATASSTGPYCVGETIELSSGGGISFLWSGPLSFSSTNQNPSIASCTTNMAGTYTVQVTDGNTCTANAVVDVVININPIAEAGTNQSIPYGSFTNLAGSGSGGSGNYSYAWSPSDSLLNAGLQNPQTVNLEATTVFTVTVTDVATGCTSTDQVTITIIGGPLSANLTTADADICNGDQIQLDAGANGGSGTYTYTWASDPVGFTSVLANPTVNPAVTTTYYVTVNDGFNNVTDNIIITVNPLPSITAGYTGPYCEGEDIELNATGGTGYVWSGPLSYASTSPSPIIPASTIAMGGTYTVVVSDAVGCSASQNVNVIVNPIPDVDAGTNTAVCYGGSANLNAGSGYSSYLWSPAGTLSDAAIYNPVATPLVPTMYYVTVTNQYSCTDVDSVEVDVRGLPGIFAITGGGQFCPGGSGVTLTLSGSESGVNYNVFLNGNNVASQPGTGNALNFTLTQGGTYTVVAVDALAGCTQSMTGTVTVSLYPQPDLSASVNDISCFGQTDGSITASVTSGAPPYTYAWSHSGSLTTGTATALANGNYTITVSDNNGCTDTYTATVIQPAVLQVSTSSTNVSCYGDVNGTATATPAGGTSPFLYNWSTGGNSSMITGLAVGSYQVTVTDNHSCTATSSVIVGQPSIMTLEDSTANLTCFGSGDGYAEVDVLGGTSPFTYLWSNGLNTNYINQIQAGTYSVTVTDNSGCSQTVSMSLTQPDAITVTVTDGISTTDNLGFANATSAGGAGTHSYNWSNGSPSQNISGLQSGYYILTVTDQMGCMAMDTIVIDIEVLIPTAITPNADGKNDDFEILGVGSFPKLTIEIYTRWGAKIFFFEGTGLEYCQPSNRWNGTHNGKELPIGAYQYIIHLEGYSEPFTGQVLLMR